jgi:hypothetical protein
VVLLAALSDSLDWLGDVISQLGSGAITSSSITSPVTSPLQERERARARRPTALGAQHRRASSQSLTSGLAILADKFHNLSVEFIRTLRLEMQLQTAYHFQVGGGISASVAEMFIAWRELGRPEHVESLSRADLHGRFGGAGFGFAKIGQRFSVE